MGGVLAIDLGEKKTGFAAADPLRIAVRALDVCRHGGDREALFAHLDGLLAERDVTTFLIGRPLHMDGSAGERVRWVEAFAAELARRFPDIPRVLYDERLTSKAAEELLREAGYRGAEIKARRDSWSALVLLRDWIESGEPSVDPAP